MFSKHTLQTMITTVASSIAKVTHTLAYRISKNLLMNYMQVCVVDYIWKLLEQIREYMLFICDCICKKGSYTHNYKYLEIQFWNIQFNISRESLELAARVSPQIYSYSK